MIAQISGLSDPPLALTSAGMYFQEKGCDPACQIVPSGLERVELVLGGQGWFRCDGRLTEVRPGHLLWHVAGDETISRSNWQDAYSCLSLFFRVNPSAPLRDVPRLSVWNDLAAARVFAEQVIRWHVDDSVDRQGLLYYTYGSLLIQAKRQPAGPVPAGLSERARFIVGMLERDFASPVRLGAVARAAGCSLSSLHALIRRELDTTPHALVQSRRLRAAREMLASTRLSVKEIAVACGFGGASSFCHAFKRHTGSTPKAYRLVQSGCQQA